MSVHNRAYLLKQAPKNFVRDFNPRTVNSEEIMEERQRYEIGKNLETVLWCAAMQEKVSCDMSHTLDIANIRPHVTECNE